MGGGGGCMGESRKFKLVRWDKVCSPIECGRLGIRKITTFTKALLGKWLGCFGAEDTQL